MLYKTMSSESSRNDADLIELPTPFPYRCMGRHTRKVAPRHYHLRQRICRRNRKRNHGRIRKTRTRTSKRMTKSQPSDLPRSWRYPSDAEKQDDYANLEHKLLHQSHMMYDLRYGISLNDFVSTVHPIEEWHAQEMLMRSDFLQSSNEKKQEQIKAADIAALEIQKTIDATVDKSTWPGWPSASDKILTEVRRVSVYFTPKEDEGPVVLDTGASISITPYGDAFVGPIEPSQLTSLTGLTDSTPVVGRGRVEWSIVDVFGVVRTIRTNAYFVPTANIRLFSPQAYFQEHDAGRCVMTASNTTLTLADGTDLVFPYNHQKIGRAHV